MNVAVQALSQPLREVGMGLAERLVTRRLESLEGGVLEVEQGGRVRRFGRPSADALMSSDDVRHRLPRRPMIVPRLSRMFSPHWLSLQTSRVKWWLWVSLVPNIVHQTS